MTRELNLSQLTTELTDFLGLPEDIDLPPLHTITCKRTRKTAWSVTAWVDGRTDEQRWEAMTAWARFAGGEVTFGRPYASGHQPSGMQRTLTLTVVVAEVPIVLESAVDALFQAPQAAEAVTV